MISADVGNATKANDDVYVAGVRTSIPMLLMMMMMRQPVTLDRLGSYLIGVAVVLDVVDDEVGYDSSRWNL